MGLVGQLVLEQPFKIPFVGAVVLVLNTIERGAGIVGEVVRRVGESVQAGVGNGRWRDVKCGLKFLGGLQGILRGEGVWVVLEDVLGKAVDLQTERAEEVSSPFSLIWVDCEESCGIGEAKI